MIPSIYIVHVVMKLTHEQQAPDNSSALVNKTAVAQTVIHHKAWIMLVQNSLACARAASISRDYTGFVSSQYSGLHQYSGFNTVFTEGG